MLLVGTAILAWFVVIREGEDVQRFRRIKVGMELRDVQNLYPETEPVPLLVVKRFDQDPQPAWTWVFDDGDLTVEVDRDRRVTGASYQYFPASGQWLDVAAGWLGITRSPQVRVITMP
jgi:hypothetical protein